MIKKYSIFMDGASWCATNQDFESLAVDPAGFGDTPEEALVDLIKQEKK